MKATSGNQDKERQQLEIQNPIRQSVMSIMSVIEVPIANNVQQKKISKKLIAFDFDQTLSIIHLYSTLKQKKAGAEIDQIRLLLQLNREYQPEENKKQSNTMKGYSENEVFGGKNRIRILATMFDQLIKFNCTLIIVSKGYVGAIAKALADVNLLQYFSMIYGNIGGYYQFGEENLTESKIVDGDIYNNYLGQESQNINAFQQSKEKLIDKIRFSQNYKKNQVLLVDDDKDMIEGMLKKHMNGILIKDKKGIQQAQKDEILKWVQSF